MGSNKKNVKIRSGLSAQFQNYIPRDQRETLRLSTSLRNLQFISQNRILSENWLGGRNWTLSVQTIFWGNLMPLKKIFETNSGLWALKLQNFDKYFGTVVRNATDLSWGFFEEIYFSKKEPKICILTSSKNFVFLATFSSTIVESALFVSTGTFSES